MGAWQGNTEAEGIAGRRAEKQEGGERNRIGKTDGEVRGGRREGDKELRITFWNVGGLKNKDREFWEVLRDWDVMVLMETWMEEREWEKWRNRLPEEYKWKRQGARRNSKKVRAIGGMLMGIRNKLVVGGGRERTR